MVFNGLDGKCESKTGNRSIYDWKLVYSTSACLIAFRQVVNFLIKYPRGHQKWGPEEPLRRPIIGNKAIITIRVYKRA